MTRERTIFSKYKKMLLTVVQTVKRHNCIVTLWFIAIIYLYLLLYKLTFSATEPLWRCPISNLLWNLAVFPGPHLDPQTEVVDVAFESKASSNERKACQDKAPSFDKLLKVADYSKSITRIWSDYISSDFGVANLATFPCCVRGVPHKFSRINLIA